MYKMVAVTLGEVLGKCADFEGWLYLPTGPWDLNTEGIFIKEDLDADPSAPFPPAILHSCALSEALDAGGIEDVISNAEAQLGTPELSDLLRAFEHYVNNDAFIDFGS